MSVSGSTVSSAGSSPCKEVDSGLDLRDVDNGEQLKTEFQSNLRIMEANDNIRALLTAVRDKWVLYAV